VTVYRLVQFSCR